MSLGNATTAEDAVRIVDCEGTPLDTLLYGDDYNGDFVGDNGATDPFPDPGEGSSIGRFPDGADTDLHTDWIAYSTPSPGEPNADPGAVEDPGGSGGGGGGGSGPGDDGCGGPSSERPDGGCAAVPLPLGGLEVFALAFLGVRRRR
jgi:hypothetical protein